MAIVSSGCRPGEGDVGTASEGAKRSAAKPGQAASRTLAKFHGPQGAHYSYAPLVIRDGSVIRMWTCYNPTAGLMRDAILYTE